MAVDEALMDSVRGGSPAIVRFYGWSPPCLSLGRNQPARGHYDPEELGSRGIDVVRRTTGGRAVLHDREITYSFIAPESSLGPLKVAYSAINRALLAGLRRLGLEPELQPARRRAAPAPSVAPCFEDPAEGEIVLGGRKLLGSAQWRGGMVMLQHGSLLLSGGRQAEVAELAGTRADPGRRPTGLDEHLDPLPHLDAIIAVLADGFREEFGNLLEPSELSAYEHSLAARHRRRYEDMAWTWRR